MLSRIFLDTNILIDFFDKREDYYDYARIINVDYIVTRDVEGFKDCGIKSVTSKEFID